MKLSVVPVALGIRVKIEIMILKQILYKISLLLFFVLSFVSCGTGNQKLIGKNDSISTDIEQDTLPAELRRKYDYFFMEAVRLKEKGDYVSAYDLYQHCLSINPKGGAVLYELSKFYMYTAQESKGEDALKQAVKLNPKNFWYNQTLAGYYQTKRNYPKAIYVYENMSQQFPTRLEPLMALTQLYTQTKQYQEVINVLDKLENLDGKSEAISMEKFRMYVAMGNMDKAFSEMKSLADEYPYDMRYLTMLGDVYVENGKPEEALKTYQEVLEKEPGYGPVQLSLANFYQHQGQDSLYNKQINKVLLNDNVGSDTKLNMMRQLIIRSEQTDRDSIKIASLFKRVLKEKQENADLAMLAAQYLVTKKMDSDAKPVLHQVLDIDPENTPARLQLLQYAVSKQNMDSIIAICTSALEYTPKSLEFYYYLGMAYHEKKNIDKAVDVFQKGVAQVDSTTDKRLASDLYAILGDMYHEKKDNELAYAAYDSSLVYKSDNIGALNNYAYYLSLEHKNLDKAEEMSYKTVQAEPQNETYLDTYAWILFEKGKYVEAKIYIDQAMQNGGDKSSVETEHCGDIYWMNGEKEKAVEYWKKAEELSKEKTQNSESSRDKDELRVLKKKITYKKYFAK